MVKSHGCPLSSVLNSAASSAVARPSASCFPSHHSFKNQATLCNFITEWREKIFPWWAICFIFYYYNFFPPNLRHLLVFPVSSADCVFPLKTQSRMSVIHRQIFTVILDGRDRQMSAFISRRVTSSKTSDLSNMSELLFFSA